jgi:hypothetical protein
MVPGYYCLIKWKRNSRASLEEKTTTNACIKKQLFTIFYKTNPCLPGDDARGRKRERDRARWQAMAKDKKDEINKKR